MTRADGWHTEALQLRKNHDEDCAAVSAFVDLFEKEIDAMPPLLCLALHHVAMRFRSHVGPKAIKKFKHTKLEDLPEAIFPADRIPKRRGVK